MNLITKRNPLRTTRWGPFSELGLETMFGRMPALRGNGGETEAVGLAEWSPSVDITEDNEEYLVKAELPEVKKEDVKVTVENGGRRRHDERLEML